MKRPPVTSRTVASVIDADQPLLHRVDTFLAHFPLRLRNLTQVKLARGVADLRVMQRHFPARRW